MERLRKTVADIRAPKDARRLSMLLVERPQEAAATGLRPSASPASPGCAPMSHRVPVPLPILSSLSPTMLSPISATDCRSGR